MKKFAQVRYRGKKLDAYKNNWYRQKRLQYEKGEDDMGKFDYIFAENLLLIPVMRNVVYTFGEWKDIVVQLCLVNYV